MKKTVIIGAGRGGELVAGMLSCFPSVKVVGFVDDLKPLGSKIDGIEVIGKVKMLEDLKKKHNFDSLVISISSDMEFRKKVFEDYKGKFDFISVIHPSVIIDKGVRIGRGNVICGNCYIASKASIGDNNWIAASTSIDHHNRIGSHNLIGPGTSFAGSIEVGNCCRIGSGVSVNPLVKIGDKALISTGSAVFSDIKSGQKIRARIQV
ncbi:acetyltransferase [Candidatus Woesearchaeota archaeon]|nr:acetyltransferase [Candidatus Woesearchaeota archaeon]